MGCTKRLATAFAVAVVSVTSFFVSSMQAAAQKDPPFSETMANPPSLAVSPTASGEPFLREVAVSAGDGKSTGLGAIPIPEGKILVLEHVAGTVVLPAGQLIRLMTVRSDLGAGSFPLIAPPVAGQADLWIVSQAIKLYANREVVFAVHRLGNTGDLLARFAISGYLVDQ